MLSINSLNQYYGSSHTLHDVSLCVEPGTCSVVMGRNGVGKSTLMQCIMGLVPVKSGTVTLADTDISHLPSEVRASTGIGYVPQGRQIFPLLSVEENLRIGLRARSDASQRIPELVFELFPVLHQMLNRRGGDLSGGQQQQLAIARALVTQPDILLLDEPTEGIQPNVVHEIGNIIKRLNQEIGLTVLLVEQKLPFARQVGDIFAIMDRGKVVATGNMPTLGEDLIRQYLTV